MIYHMIYNINKLLERNSLDTLKTDWKANPLRPEYDEARQKIVEAAAAIVTDKGWKKIRFDTIAKEVGCARPTLYRYFNSKEELLSAVLIHLMYLLASELTDAIKDIEDSTEALVEVTYLGASYLRDEKRYSFVMDPDNIKYLTRIAIETIPKEMAPLIKENMESKNGKNLLNNDISFDEAGKWLIMQIVSMAQFGPIGKSPEEEKSFIRKMVIPILFES